MKTQQAALTSAGLYLTVMMVAFDASALFPVVPALHASFPLVPLASIGWTVKIYSIGLASFLMLGGILASRYGSQNTYRYGTTLFALSSAACILATRIEILIIFRFLQAIAGALILPSSLALLIYNVPSLTKGRIIANWTAFGGLAAGSAPLIAAAATRLWSWHVIFAVNLPLCVLAILADRTSGRSGEAAVQRWQHKAVWPFGALLVGGAAAGISLGIEVASAPATRGFGTILLILAIGMLLLSVRFLRSEPAAEYVANAQGVLTQIAVLIFGVSFGLIFFCYPLMIDSSWHYSVVKIGMVMSILTMLSVPVVTLTKRATGYRQRILVFLCGASCLTLEGLLASMACVHHNMWLGAAAIMLSAIGIGLSFPALNTIALMWGSVNTAALGSSLTQTARHSGTAIGVGIGVSIFSNYRESHLGVSAAAQAGSGICLVVLCLALLLYVETVPQNCVE